MQGFLISIPIQNKRSYFNFTILLIKSSSSCIQIFFYIILFFNVGLKEENKKLEGGYIYSI